MTITNDGVVMNKMIRFLMTGFCLLLCGAHVYAQSNAQILSELPTTLALPTIASLTGGNFSVVPTVTVLGYRVKGDKGGGTFYRNGTSCTTDSGTIFKDNAGNCFYRVGTQSSAVSLEWFGAYGDATTSLSGVANGTTTFTDSSANCTAAAAAGKTHIVIVPPSGTANAQVNTTFTCNSLTSFALSVAPSWSASNVTYAIGHDDGAAWTAAAAYVNAVPNNQGQLNLESSAYLVTSLPGGLGTFSASIAGLQGTNSQLLIGGLSSADGIKFSFTNVSNVQFWCGYAGNDCVDIFDAIAGAVFTNISVQYANRDCFTSDSTSGNGLENIHFNTFTASFCGRHGFSVYQTSPAYFNISKFTNGNLRILSTRQSGGTCVYGATTAQSLNIAIDTLECDSGYGASYPFQTTYTPLPNAIYFNANSWGWSFNNLAIESTGASYTCGASVQCESIAMNIANGATMAMTACNVTANSYWATISHVGVCYNAAGVLPLVATSGNATIASSAAYTTLNGNVYLQNYGTGSNGSMGQWRVLGPGGGTPVYTQIGTTGTVGTPESFTTAATATSGVTNIAVTNTASSASTLYYLITDANLVSFKTQ